MHNPVKGQASLGSGYKATKIGTVPSSWDVVRLEEVTDPSAPIRYGVVQIGPDTPGGVPIVPIKHIRRIGDVPLHHASPEIEAPYAGSRVKGGDVLVSVKGTIGDVGVVPDGFKGNIAREIARIRPKPDYDAEFLALQLEADHTQRRIESKGWTPSMRSLSSRQGCTGTSSRSAPAHPSTGVEACGGASSRACRSRSPPWLSRRQSPRSSRRRGPNSS